MTILHGVTGDTGPGDTEPRRVALRATSDGKLLVDGAGGGGGGGASAQDIGEAVGDDLRGGAKLPTNILMGLGGAKAVAAGSSSARVQLATSGIVGVSITAVGADMHFALGDGTVAATTSSHYLPEGQSRDFRVATSQYIAAIRAGDTDGVLEITELTA